MPVRVCRFALLAAALLLAASARNLQAQAPEPTDPRACELGGGPAVTAARYAIACAEKFVRRNGYTSLPASADSSMISREAEEPAGSVAELLDRRRDTLEPQAFGICVGNAGEGYVVPFRYRAGSKTRARAVVMSVAFDQLRVYPQDFNLALVPGRREGCLPVDEVPVEGPGR